MKRALLLLLLAFPLAACSSSSSAGEPTNHPADAAVDSSSDTSPDTGVVVEQDSDTTADDTGSTNPPDVNIVPPPNPCDHVTCTGAYQTCCRSTGTCYDSRCATCCY